VEGRQPALDLLGEDGAMSLSSLVRSAVVLVAAGVLATGCSDGDPEASPKETPRASVTPVAPAPPAPEIGSCHELSLTEATDPVDTGGAVPCRRPHTSVTVKVGQIDPVVDGHLLALDSRTVRARIAKSCPAEPGDFLGGDQTDRRLSRFEVVWFSPSLEQSDAGANWYRCDLVAVRGEGELLPLPAKVRGILDREGALDRFGTCGTAAPDRPSFTRVVCSERHSWRAVDVIALPRDARYLAKPVAAQGDAACKDVAAERANGELKYTWSFEWPTHAQWAAGQRYGYCWVPEAG
jgi:hypothetical protein